MSAEYPPDKQYRERTHSGGSRFSSTYSLSKALALSGGRGGDSKGDGASIKSDSNGSLTKSLSAKCLARVKFWKHNKKTLTITEPDPTYKVVYLGNVVTPWAKGENCVDKPLDTLWRNFCANMKHEIGMKLTICNQGLKAITREHGLTEYWANRVTYCTAHSSYPKVFCWIYRHEGRKMKQELRCHAVLCRSEASPPRMAQLLNSRLTTALAEFKREKKLRQNARLSLAGTVHDLPSALPMRKQLLIKGLANFRPPLERSKSAPKLHSIVEDSEELFEEDEEEDEEEEDDDYTSSYVDDCEVDPYASDIDTEVETTSGCGGMTSGGGTENGSLSGRSARSAISEPPFHLSQLRSRSSSLRTRSSARAQKAKSIHSRLPSDKTPTADQNSLSSSGATLTNQQQQEPNNDPTIRMDESSDCSAAQNLIHQKPNGSLVTNTITSSSSGTGSEEVNCDSLQRSDYTTTSREGENDDDAPLDLAMDRLSLGSNRSKTKTPTGARPNGHLISNHNHQHQYNNGNTIVENVVKVNGNAMKNHQNQNHFSSSNNSNDKDLIERLPRDNNHYHPTTNQRYEEPQHEQQYQPTQQSNHYQLSSKPLAATSIPPPIQYLVPPQPPARHHRQPAPLPPILASSLAADNNPLQSALLFSDGSVMSGMINSESNLSPPSHTSYTTISPPQTINGGGGRPSLAKRLFSRLAKDESSNGGSGGGGNNSRSYSLSNTTTSTNGYRL